MRRLLNVSVHFLTCKDRMWRERGNVSLRPKGYQRISLRTILHCICWDEQMLCSRKTAGNRTNVNPNSYKTKKAFQNQRKKATFPLSPVVLMQAVPNALPVSVLTCVSAKMSFEVGTFEICFPAAWKVANIVPPSGKVYLRGTILSGGNKHWSRGKRQ